MRPPVLRAVDLRRPLPKITSRKTLLALLRSMDRHEALHVEPDAVRLQPDGAGIVPRTYVRLPADRALLPIRQDRFIAEAAAATPTNPFTAVDLPSSHLGVLLAPDRLAEVLTSEPLCQ